LKESCSVLNHNKGAKFQIFKLEFPQISMVIN